MDCGQLYWRPRAILWTVMMRVGVKPCNYTSCAIFEFYVFNQMLNLSTIFSCVCNYLFLGGVGGAKGAWPRWEEGECVYLVEVWMEEVGRVISDQAAILTDCSKVNPTDQLSANMSVS